MDTYNGYANFESFMFEVNAGNRYDIYTNIIGYAKNCLSRVPSMTRQTLGFNIKTEVAIWIAQAKAGETIYSLGWWDRPVEINPQHLLDMANEIGDYSKVSENDIADSFWEVVTDE